MKSVRTATRCEIDQGQIQVVFAQKPPECAHCGVCPLSAVVCPPGRKARRDRRGCLDWLLIETFRWSPTEAKAFRADWPEASGGTGLSHHQPAQRPQTHIDIGGSVGGEAG